MPSSLPASFLSSGFVSPEDACRVVTKTGKKLRRLMIGTDGPADSGKTEFAISAPGPGILLALDRGFDGVLDNPTPPASRRNDYGFKVVKVPLASQMTQGKGEATKGGNFNEDKFDGYLDYWRSFYKDFKAACDNPDCRTVIIDGDSDSWELQKLAEFGKLTQIPPILYTNVNAARRAMYARAYDTGKIIIATNKIKDEYVDDVDDKGNVKLDDKGNKKRIKSGEMERQGFPDQNYLFMIQLRHMYKAPWVTPKGKEIPGQFGIRIMKCKSNQELVGSELWGDDCNFRGLVEHVFPNVDLTEWGFDA